MKKQRNLLENLDRMKELSGLKEFFFNQDGPDRADMAMALIEFHVRESRPDAQKMRMFLTDLSCKNDELVKQEYEQMLQKEKTTQGNYADNILSQNQPIGEMKGVGENPQGTIGNTQNEA